MLAGGRLAIAARVLRAARALRGQDHLAKGQPFVAVQAPEDMRPKRGCSCHALRYPYVYVWAGELMRRFQPAVSQSRDTATFLEVCLARWVGALGITIVRP